MCLFIGSVERVVLVSQPVLTQHCVNRIPGCGGGAGWGRDKKSLLKWVLCRQDF